MMLSTWRLDAHPATKIGADVRPAHGCACSAERPGSSFRRPSCGVDISATRPMTTNGHPDDTRSGGGAKPHHPVRKGSGPRTPTAPLGGLGTPDDPVRHRLGTLLGTRARRAPADQIGPVCGRPRTPRLATRTSRAEERADRGGAGHRARAAGAPQPRSAARQDHRHPPAHPPGAPRTARRRRVRAAPASWRIVGSDQRRSTIGSPIACSSPTWLSYPGSPLAAPGASWAGDEEA